MGKHFNLAVDADGIALLTMDSPGRSMNVFYPEVEQELAGIVEQVVADAAVRGVIVTSGKPSFIAGYDLTEFLRSFGPHLTAAEAYDRLLEQPAGDLPAHRDRRQAVGRGDQRARAGWRLRAVPRVPLPCHGGRSEGVRRPARSEGRPAAGRRRYATHAAPDRHRPGAAVPARGRQHRREGREEAGPGPRNRRAGRLDRRRAQVVARHAERRAAVGPEGLQGAGRRRVHRARASRRRSWVHRRWSRRRRCTTTRRRPRSCPASTKARCCRSTRVSTSRRSISPSSSRARCRAT